MRLRTFAVLLALATSAFAGDPDFDRVVKAIESHYGTHRLHIPFMGLASFVVNVARPEGATGFKLAVFEDMQSNPEYAEWEERDRFLDSIVGEMHPLVRVHSRRDGNSTYIFAEPSGKTAKMLIATFDRDNATVIQVKVNLRKLMESIEEPEHAGKTLTTRNSASQE